MDLYNDERDFTEFIRNLEQVLERKRGFEQGDARDAPERGLVSRGYSDEDVLKLLGGNWLRLLGETIG